jgi:hypothetical protein
LAITVVKGGLLKDDPKSKKYEDSDEDNDEEGEAEQSENDL